MSRRGYANDRELLEGLRKVLMDSLAAGSSPEATWLEQARYLRQVYGGARVYIAKEPATTKTLGLAVGLSAGFSLRDAFEAVGVSRRHGYRLISRRR